MHVSFPSCQNAFAVQLRFLITNCYEYSCTLYMIRPVRPPVVPVTNIKNLATVNVAASIDLRGGGGGCSLWGKRNERSEPRLHRIAREPTMNDGRLCPFQSRTTRPGRVCQVEWRGTWQRQRGAHNHRVIASYPPLSAARQPCSIATWRAARSGVPAAAKLRSAGPV